MIDLDVFLNEINPKAPSCPAPTAYLAIRQAADELLTRSRQWRHCIEIPIMDLEEICIDVPDQSALLDFESVLFNDLPLEAKTVAWMDNCMRGWRRGTIEGTPRFYTQLAMDTLRVAPIDNGMLQVNCILKPSMDADQLPDFVYDKYHEIIAWGALGRILSTPGQPFTDFNVGAAYLAAFSQKVDALAWKGATGQQRATMRTRGQYM